MDAGLPKIMPGRKARFAGKDLQCQCASQASQAPSGQSRLRRGQFRLRGQMRSRADPSRDDKVSGFGAGSTG